MNSDFLIIGGGVVGLATAFRLARDGATVTVVERGTIGAEASWAGGGILAPLLPWQYSAAVTDLCLHSAALYPDWVTTVQASGGLDTEYWRCGMEILAPFERAAANEWCAMHSWKSLPRTVPGDPPDAPSALWLPDVAQVRNPRLVKSLRAAVVALGVQLLEHTEISGLTSDKQHVAHLRTAHDALRAHTYIVCAGAWSQSVLSDHPPAKTIKPIRGQMLLFQTDPNCLRHIIYHQGIYLIPRRGGHILVGSTLEDTGFDKSTTATARQMLSEHAFGLLPALRKATLQQHWSGLRPGSPDNIPTIDRHPTIDNLYINAGHFRYGVTMAPASADLIADLILGRTPELDMDAYGWES